MIRNLQDGNRVNMTSFWGDTIYASASEICNKLGVKITCYDGDKTHFEFELETEDGTPFTLYDWKEGDWVTEDMPLYYHIGAKSALESRKVLEALKGLGF